MPRDAGLQDLIDRLLPPIVGENLDLRKTRKTLRLDGAAQSLDVDYAVAHHAAVVEEAFCGHQPVADVKRLEAILSGAFDLRQYIRVPPDVIDVERDAEQTGPVGIKRVADIERLLCRVDAGAVGGIGRMQRLDG